MQDINLWAVLTAALSAFVLGGLWYSPLMFLNPWLKATGRTMDDAQSGHPAMIYGLAFILSVIAAAVFAWFLGPEPELKRSLTHGALVGLALVSTSFGINYLFAGRKWTLFLIDGGYHTLQFVLYGLILGLWH